jgi:hypothetical protein
VIQIHGEDFELSNTTDGELHAAAHMVEQYHVVMGVETAPKSEVGFLTTRLHELTRQFSRAEAEESALRDANNYELSDEIVHRDAIHMRELGSFEALIEYHNTAQKETGLNLARINAVLGNDPEIAKIRDIVENGAVIDMTPEFRAIHRTAPYRNLQLRMLPVYKKAVADMHAKNKVLLFDVADIPPDVYAKMHTANEYHWRPEHGKVAGRPLLDCSNCALDETPLNSKATKELGIARYQKVTLPTFHEVLLAWDNYRIDANITWADMWMFKADISGCFNQLHWSKESVYLMGFHLQINILMIMLTCGFGVGVTPMVWSLIGDALNRYVQALCLCIVFTFVDDFFGAGTYQHAIDAQSHVHKAIRDTLGFEGLSVKKNVFAQTAEILGFLVDLPMGTVRPKNGAIEKLFYVLFRINARAPQTLRYWQCLASLVNMYSPVLRGMRPFVAQINTMTSKTTKYRKEPATPAALFEIEMWRVAIIIALQNPPALAVPLHNFIRNPRDREPHPVVSDASPWRLCAALYCAITGIVLAWATYRLPYKKDIVCKSQGHREYLGHLWSILLLVRYAKTQQPAPLQYFWVNDNKGALAWAEKNKCASLASQYACMAVCQLHIQNDIYMGKPIYRPGINMGEIDAMSRMQDDETEESPRIRALCPGLTPNTQIHMNGEAIDELFMLCDPAIVLANKNDHHTTYIKLQALLARLK